MKKKILVILAVMSVFTTTVAEPVDALSKGEVEYRAGEYEISVFKKEKGNLTVKADEFYVTDSSNRIKRVAMKKITFKIAKNCKWLSTDMGNYNMKTGKWTYHKTSYEKVKKEISMERKFYIKNYKKGAEMDSPTVMNIVIKNNKIVKILTSGC